MQEQVRSMIGNFFTENWTKGKVHNVKHFKAMRIAQNTIYRVLRRFEEGVGAIRKSGSGRPAVKLSPKRTNKMIKEILSKVGVSKAKMGRKYGVHRTITRKVLKIKQKSAPKYYPGEKERAKKAAGLL